VVDKLLVQFYNKENKMFEFIVVVNVIGFIYLFFWFMFGIDLAKSKKPSRKNRESAQRIRDGISKERAKRLNETPEDAQARVDKWRARR
jgi:hypothetical protein